MGFIWAFLCAHMTEDEDLWVSSELNQKQSREKVQKIILILIFENCF